MPNKLLKNLIFIVSMAVTCFTLCMSVSAADINDLTFVPYDNGVMITSCVNSTSGYLKIPAEYNGKKVIKIGDRAFENCFGLTSIEIPDSVTEIGVSAFEGCTSLSEVAFSDNLKKIGADAFFACDSLNTVILPVSLKEIGPFAFFDCENLRHVVIPDNINIIPEGAFGECTKLTTISLPFALDVIDYDAFINCTSIENVYYVGSYISFNLIDWTEGNESIFCEALTYNFSHEHKFTDFIAVKSATCTNGGVLYNNACVCGLAYGKVRTEALGHNPVTSPEVIATCETSGKTCGTVCSYCDIILSGCEKIPASGHIATTLNAKAPSCTEDGHTEVVYCKTCAEILSGGETIKSSGHNWTVYSQTVADCATGIIGSRTDICTNCGLKEVVESGIKHPYDEWIIIQKPTCTESGLKYRKCTKSGCDAYEEAIIEKISHTLRYLPAKDATCLSPGYTEGSVCIVCHTVVAESVGIPAKGHSIITVAEIPATCITPGTSGYSYCTNCNYKQYEAIEYPAFGHIAGEWKITTEPNCQKNGVMKKQCKFCDMTMAEYSLDMLSHSYTLNWTTVIQPTCTDTGLSLRLCANCTDIQSSTLPALGHSDTNDDGKCDICSVPLSQKQNCSCNCHKSGISNLLFRLLNFFQKLLGKNKVCACGASH